MYQRCVKLRINPEFKNYKKLPPNAIVDSAPKVTRIPWDFGDTVVRQEING